MSLQLLEDNGSSVAELDGEPVSIVPDPKEVFRPKVALCFPFYGLVEPWAARSVFSDQWVHPVGTVTPTAGMFTSASATPHTFNYGIAPALDLRDRGEITHFAMLHSDVCPKNPGWIEALWAEMERENAVMMSAVIPIKEKDDDRTSTAIGDLDNIWMAKRYVRNRHRGILPVTFGPEAVCQPGEVLLCNTGCMLLDLRHEYLDEFAFEFKTRIIKGENGRRVPQFAPEDWLLSRLIQANGGRICATWAVALTHKGTAEWANDV